VLGLAARLAFFVARILVLNALAAIPSDALEGLPSWADPV
jgi:hypothetical protein